MKPKSLYVYHERQASALCGVHCINALFQQPTFTELDLAKIAHDLDEKERMVMMESGNDSADFLKFMAEESVNVGDDGNFSIQVLMKALHAKNLDCKPVTSTNFDSVFSSLHFQDAFILNRGAHWFTVRKIEGEWYNLNSVLPQPKHIPELYLAHELKSLTESGHAVYLVEGKLPPIPATKECTSDGRWIRIKGDDEGDLELAIQASLAVSTPSNPNESHQKPTPPMLPMVPEQSFYPPNPFIEPNPQEIEIFTQIHQVHLNFGKCFAIMEKVETRLANLEKTISTIQNGRS